MKLQYQALLCFLFFWASFQASSKIKMDIQRIVLKYQNKSLINPVEFASVRRDRSNIKYLKYQFCTKVPLIKKDKVNIKAYFVKNNMPLFSGIQFDVPYCKERTSDIFGIRHIFKGSNLTSCPLKAGCYGSNAVNLNMYTLPAGVPLENYMTQVALFTSRGIMFSFDMWFELKEVYE